MPVANKYELQEVLAACDTYFEKTGRRITFEYSLVTGRQRYGRGCGGSVRDFSRTRNCHMNLIPVNPVKERSFRAAEAAKMP